MAGATDLYWIESHGGLASDADNWNPTRVPTASDMLYFDLASKYRVTFDELVTESGRMTFHRGDVDLEFTDAHDTGIVYVARDGADSVETSVIGGELTGVNVYIGRRGEGTLTVTGVTSLFNQRTGTDFYVGYDDGDGTLVIEDGGTVSVGHHMSVGRSGARPVGEITVSGTAFDGHGWVPSLLSVGDAYVFASSTYLGYGAGAGILNVSNGARADVEDLRVSYDDASSRGQISVGGAENGLYATLNVSEAMHVGDSNGSGTVEVDADGRVVVGRTTYLGAAGSGRGTLNLDGGELRTHSLDVRETGVVNFDGGTLVVEGGSLTDAHTTITVADDSTLKLTQGAVANVYAGGFALGDSGGAGNLCLESDSSLTTGTAYIGETAAVSHAVVSGQSAVDACSSWTITGLASVGNSGAGTLSVTDGGAVSTGASLIVADGTDANGQLYVQGVGSGGAASQVDVGLLLKIGHYGGSGYMAITDGGKVVAARDVEVSYTSETGPATHGEALVSGIHAGGTRSTLSVSPSMAFDLRVGYRSTGRLTVENGALVTIADGAYIGAIYGNGSVVVRGTGHDGNDWLPATLRLGTAGPSFGYAYVGVDPNSVGTLTVVDGGLVEAAGMFVAWNRETGHGEVTVGGMENGRFSTIDLEGYLHIGYPSGAGIFTVDSAGRAIVGETTYLGAPGGSGGTLALNAGGAMLTGSMEIGQTGVVDFAGGALVIDGGELTDVHTDLTIGGDSELWLQGGATCTAYSSGLTVGGATPGTLKTLGGSSLSTGDATVGQAAGLSEVLIDGEGLTGAGSSWDVDGYLRVGEEGSGSLTVAAGAELSVRDVVEVACRGVADGWLYVHGARSDGSSSKLSAESGIVVGGFIGGTGHLEITDGGLVECEGGVSLGYSGLFPGDGTVLVSGINAATAARSTLTLRPVDTTSLVLGSGTNSTGELIVEQGGLVEFTNEVIVGHYDMGADGTITVEGTGHDGGQWVPSALRPASKAPTTMYLGINPNTLGVLNVLDGGLVEVGTMHVGYISTTGVGQVTVGGWENGCEATLTVAGDLHVGDSNGTGTVTVGDFGNVMVGGMTHLGHSSGSGGTLGLNICGTVKTHSMEIGETGVLNFDGGTLIVDGGTFDDVHDSRTIAASSTLRLENGACADVYLDPWAGALFLGDATGPAFLSVLDGSTLSTNLLYIGGYSVGPHSEVTVAGDAGADTPSRLVVAASSVGGNSKGKLYIQNGGEFEASIGNLLIGVGGAGEGEAHVTGARADGNSSSLRVAGYMSIGSGMGGAGLLAITEGGLVDVGGEVKLGDGMDANGDVLISGIHSGTAARSTLRGRSNMTLGGFGGGTVTVEDGGLMEVDDWLVIGLFTSHETQVTVSGVHANGTPAEVAVGDRTILGSLCEHGRLFIREGGLFTTDSLMVGGNGPGTATVDGVAPGGERSTLAVSGAMTVSAFGPGTLEVRDGALLTVDGNTLVGFDGIADGLLEVTGVAADGTPSAFLSPGPLDIGDLGSGEVGVSGGGQVEAGDVAVAKSPGSSGRLSVSGPGSSFHSTGDVFVGGDSNGPGGTGSLWVSTHATMTVDGRLKIWDTGSAELVEGTLSVGVLEGDGNPGALAFDYGTLRIAGDLDLDLAGPLYPVLDLKMVREHSLDHLTKDLIVGGTTTIHPDASITIDGGGLSTGALVVNGGFEFLSGSFALTDSGLTIGTAGLLGDDVCMSQLRRLSVSGDTHVEGGARLTVDGTTFPTGSLTNEGEVLLAGLGARIEAATAGNSGLIRGDGRIVGSLTNQAGGEVRVESGKRLVIDGANGENAGRISLYGGTMEFTEPITNAPGGDILGRGVLIARGGLTNRGDVALSNGITDVSGDTTNDTGGRIIVSGRADVTFWDDVRNAGAMFKVSDGSSATFFGAYSGGGISGGGETYFEADVTPGFSAAMIDFGGDVTFGPLANLHIELANADNSDPLDPRYDALDVARDVELAGTLSLTWLPVPGDPNSKFGGAYSILTWGETRTGIFDGIDCAMAAYLDTSLFDDGIEYDDANGVVRVHLYDLLDGDADLDGKVARSDFHALQVGFGSPDPDWFTGDFNLDGRVNFLDYLTWKANVGDAVPGAEKIPEPATLSVLALGACLALLRRPRSRRGR